MRKLFVYKNKKNTHRGRCEQAFGSISCTAHIDFKKILKLKNFLILVILILFGLNISGCASDSSKTICPNYGKWCHKRAINSWYRG